MNIGTIICLTLAIFFILLSLIFTLLKEKAALLISGFNTISKEEREKYDKKKMSIDMRNSLFLWSIILLLGVASSYFINKYCSIIAIVIWLIVFLKDIHINSDKAFEKYKKS
ncbi:DUF3784 domain-containing protein [Clostridium weizhouense]|uniref:DUF3784 domain-containing protein n=1 Tax=Clostridium weizhouense TaxID=2859781 RepID=A0ABS7ANR7_9CLOT|nr:DUF3784 domain-containing protein [Clostridium weizhouense]MBW6410318.1 DUF3784 domain-containing protein [Clostridium weizhouense]